MHPCAPISRRIILLLATTSHEFLNDATCKLQPAPHCTASWIERHLAINERTEVVATILKTRLVSRFHFKILFTLVTSRTLMC